MPEIPKFPAFDVTSKLQTELEFNLSAGRGNPLAGTGATISERLQVQNVIQNPNGTWSETVFDKEFPVKDQNEITEKKKNERNSMINSYEQMASVYDNIILDSNTQINQKKAQIISLVNTAIGAGCSHIPVFIPLTYNIPRFITNQLPPPPPLVINGVTCGIGSFIYGDEAQLKIYPNITNYSTDNPFSPISNENLSSSNVGKGFENTTSNNTGSNFGRYYTIPTNPNQHGILLTPEQKTTCVGYGVSILTIASEIGVLRSQRDQYLTQLNELKILKSKEELRRWGNNQADASIEEYNNSLKSAISSISQFIDNIVIEGLIVHFDSGQTYGIQTTLESQTGINAVTTWNNLTGDGLYAEPQTSSYSINLDTADGPSVELNNNVTSTDQYFTIQSSYIGSDKIESGNTSYTIEVWVKITQDTNLGISSTTNGANIVGINSVFGYGLQVFKPSGIRVSFGERGNGRLANSTNLNTNTWYHIVATNEESVGSKIYINSVLDGSGGPINITSSLNNLQFGYAPDKISQYFSGKLSIVRIYKKALSQSEVKKNYDAHKERFGY